MTSTTAILLPCECGPDVDPDGKYGPPYAMPENFYYWMHRTIGDTYVGLYVDRKTRSLQISVGTIAAEMQLRSFDFFHWLGQEFTQEVGARMLDAMHVFLLGPEGVN